MAKTARLELRVEPELKARLEAKCDVLGMKVATFVERAVEGALEFEGRLPKPPRSDADALRQEEQALRDVDGSRSVYPAVLPSGKVVTVESTVGRCPSCGLEGPVGGSCPQHRALRFKAVS